MTKDQEDSHKRTDVAIKNLEVQMRQLYTDFANLKRTSFFETTLDNPMNETCKMMERRILIIWKLKQRS